MPQLRCKHSLFNKLQFKKAITAHNRVVNMSYLAASTNEIKVMLCHTTFLALFRAIWNDAKQGVGVLRDSDTQLK